VFLSVSDPIPPIGTVHAEGALKVHIGGIISMHFLRSARGASGWKLMVVMSLLSGVSCTNKETPPRDSSPKASVEGKGVGSQGDGLSSSSSTEKSAAFIRSVFAGEIEGARQALRSGVDVNLRTNPSAPGDSALTPLVIAVLLTDLEMVQLLLDSGADPRLTVRGYSAIDFAIEANETQILSLLSKQVRSGKFAKASALEGGAQ